MTVMINDVLRPCFFLYISLSSLRATNTGLSRLRGIYYVPKLSHTLLTENWTASYLLLTGPLASKTYLYGVAIRMCFHGHNKSFVDENLMGPSLWALRAYFV